jgi:hypothetical protein
LFSRVFFLALFGRVSGELDVMWSRKSARKAVGESFELKKKSQGERKSLEFNEFSGNWSDLVDAVITIGKADK